jgi:hypothetical protein
LRLVVTNKRVDLSSRVAVFAGVATFAVAAFGLVRSLLRTLKARRDQRHLDEVGLEATARVVLVEPMQRPVNGAAGHPIQLAFEDRAGLPRQFRDTSGLGGYVVRVGTQVTVRYSATDPEVVRVERILAPNGPYPPERRRRTPSAIPALLALVAVVAGGAAIPIYETGAVGGRVDSGLEADLVPLMFGLIGLGILSVIGGLAIRRAATRRPTQEAVGVVTEVWHEVANTGRSGGTTVHPFTVHFAAADGREVHTRYRISSSRRLQVYQRVRVRYDPTYPPSFDVAELRHARWLLWLIPSFVGAVFLTIGAFWAAATL